MSSDHKCSCEHCQNNFIQQSETEGDPINHVTYATDPCGVVIKSDANGVTYTGVTGVAAADPYNGDCYVDSGYQLNFTDQQMRELEQRVTRLEAKGSAQMYEEMDDVDELMMDLEMMVRDNPNFYFVLEALVESIYGSDE